MPEKHIKTPLRKPLRAGADWSPVPHCLPGDAWENGLERRVRETKHDDNATTPHHYQPGLTPAPAGYNSGAEFGHDWERARLLHYISCISNPPTRPRS